MEELREKTGDCIGAMLQELNKVDEVRPMEGGFDHDYRSPGQQLQKYRP